MKLYLVRHGETTGNQQRRYIGWEDPPLTAAGEAQARELAERLRQHPITSVTASDLQRAARTAALVAAPHGLPVRLDSRLREANFGAWSGLTYAEIFARDPAALQRWIADPQTQAPPGGETLTQLTERVIAALPRADGALVVSHGGPIRALLSHFTGRPFWSWELPLCGLTILRLRPDGTGEVEAC